MKRPIAYSQTIERRTSNRRRLSVPVFFFWNPQCGPPQSGEGFTRDVTAAGVYIIADQTPAIGELVQMDILLPNPVPGGSEMHLTGKGVVLRVEPDRSRIGDDSNCGFAVSVRFHPELSKSVRSYLRGSGASCLTYDQGVP